MKYSGGWGEDGSRCSDDKMEMSAAEKVKAGI